MNRQLFVVCKSSVENIQSFWFPRPITRCQEWLTALGLNMPPENVQRNKRVCAKHFTLADRADVQLTSEHLGLDSFAKMRVSLAAQLFSHSVACIIFYNISRGTLGNNALSTATFVQDIDMLFDSFNGSSLYPTHGKHLRTAVFTSSSHLQFWETMKRKINQWRFVGYASRTMPPSQKGWFANFTAMTGIWKKCETMGLNHLRTEYPP